MKGFDDLEDFAGGQIRSVVDFDIGLLLQALKPNRMDCPGDQNLMHANDGGQRVKLDGLVKSPLDAKYSQI